jgi:hypothetical protein
VGIFVLYIVVIDPINTPWSSPPPCPSIYDVVQCLRNLEFTIRQSPFVLVANVPSSFQQKKFKTQPNSKPCPCPTYDLDILKICASLRSVLQANSKPRATSSLVTLCLAHLQVVSSPPLLIPLLILYGMQTQEHPLIYTSSSLVEEL